MCSDRMREHSKCEKGELSGNIIFSGCACLKVGAEPGAVSYIWIFCMGSCMSLEDSIDKV